MIDFGRVLKNTPPLRKYLEYKGGWGIVNWNSPDLNVIRPLTAKINVIRPYAPPLLREIL